MSIAGRIALGILCAYWSVFFVVHPPQQLKVVVYAIYILILIGIIVIYIRDRRNYEPGAVEKE